MENNEVTTEQTEVKAEPTIEELAKNKEAIRGLAELKFRSTLLEMGKYFNELTNRGLKRSIMAALSYEAIEDATFKFTKRAEAQFAGLLGRAINEKQNLMAIRQMIKDDEAAKKEEGN